MRVVHVIARMNVGGTAQYLDKLVKGLNQNGFNSLVMTGCVQAGETEDAVVNSLPIVRISRLGRKISLKADMQARNELKEQIAIFTPDIIHTHTFKAGLLVRSIKTSIPIVHTFHGHLLDDPEFSGLKRKVIIWIERILASRSSKLVSVGDSVAKELLKHKIGVASQYISIPPGIEPLKQISKAEARARLNLPQSRTIGVWLARFATVKDPLKMVEIAKAFPQVIFVMGGSGELIESVRNAAPNNLLVLGWVDAADLLSSADFLISTSHNEGMPVAFIEAQMMGIPVIATDVGSVSEVIRNRISGLVVRPEQIETALREFLAQPDLATIFSGNAVEAKDRFSKSEMIKKHIELYESIAESVGRLQT